VILIMGSNMAENHPVGFQWVVEAQRRGAKVIHVDPRFTRTSAIADVHVPIRPGTDIAFVGGLINYVLSNNREFREYVVAYSNAATIIDDEFLDTEDLDGYFSGWDAESQSYHSASWSYADTPEKAAAGNREGGGGSSERAGGHGGDHAGHSTPEGDPSLTDPRCVFQLVKRHFSRYTPQMVARVCGVSEAQFTAVAEAMCENSGRERTGAICYAVGWTHHSVGVQNIRAASILQTLLGNIGRPGGGIMALRGHASIQGSTDIPTLFDLLPGYIPMPDTATGASLAEYIENDSAASGYWGDMRTYVVSLLKAWFGETATADNEFCFDYLPRLTGDHSTYQSIRAMLDGTVKGFFALGENPAVGSGNSGMHRKALADLDWLVVRDFQETETAAFWYDAPEITSGELRTEDVPTEVFLMPAAAHTEKSGSFTQTQRLLQWHDQAVEPTGDTRSDLWFFYQLGRLVRERLAGSTDPRDRPVLDLTWDYELEGPHDSPSAEAVLAEINGRDADGKPLSTYTQLADDGSTRCGCWIYCGAYADGVNQTRRRRPGAEQTWVAPEWGWAWPANRRLLYNRASADPDGRPWSERKRYVWWDDEHKRWTGEDVPDMQADKPPDYVPGPDAKAEAALSGRDPFIMQSDGKAWLFVPSGLADGPLPAHFEPTESPVRNPVYGRQTNPPTKWVASPENPDNGSPPPAGAPDPYPYVLTTFRLTEHHTGGAMSRTVKRLSELQPEMFCEVSPQLAAERGLINGGWATIVTSRAMIEARVLVTERIQSLTMDGRSVHQVAVPFHWGSKGETVGDSANDLLGLALDPNVFIQDTKSLTCDISAGRRPNGLARRQIVDQRRSGARP
jgi:formate dehydrogenase major subunit